MTGWLSSPYRVASGALLHRDFNSCGKAKPEHGNRLGAGRVAPSYLGYHTGEDRDKTKGGQTLRGFDTNAPWLVDLSLSPGQAGLDAARRTKGNPR